MTRAFDQLWDETFRHAAEHSPFYRELFRGKKIAPPLHEIPTVDKTILSERNLDFLCVPREKIVEIVTTSGTTGKPLLWMLTESDVQRLATNEKLSFQCVGLTANDIVIVAVAMDRCFMAGLAYWLGLRELGCGIVRTGAASPTLVLEMIQRVQPTAIVAVPSFLRVIAEKAREINFDLKNSSVKKAVCIGEPIRDSGRARHSVRAGSGLATSGAHGSDTPYHLESASHALMLNSSGQIIEESWGAKVFSTYGVTEIANSLCECSAGSGGHLHDEQLFLEILDDDGKPVADGEIGEVVATTFCVEAMPLIRYRTGDCAALFREPCECGRATRRLGPIVGRKNQKLKFKGASLFPSTLTMVLEESAGVESFVVIARKENELSDSIEVLIRGSASTDALREAMQARAKIAPQIRHASAEEIEKLQMPPQAGKRRTFVDLR